MIDDVALWNRPLSGTEVGILSSGGRPVDFGISSGLEVYYPFDAIFYIPDIPEPTTFIVDIKPGSFPNSVNLKSKGVLPVAILGTDDFDVNDPNTGVDITSLLFGDPNGGTAVSPLRSALEDVSGDGFLDLSLKFSTAELMANGALGPDTTEGLLTGELLDGTPFEGMDSIRIVPPNGSNGNSLQVEYRPRTHQPAAP